ncbi:replication factor C subunit 4 [Binucleata daphniae]
MSTLWTEKYRPKDADTFECQPYLKQFLKTSTSQHLLLYGPPGTGKTTFAHLIATKEYLELNASDERGINIVRNKIKAYAAGINKQKTIILDECDSLTNDAQQCLRRVIEDFSGSTRFIFITNYLSKIIGPLKSRLLKIKFECKIENYKYLQNVGQKEGINKAEQFYNDLFVKCGYDLRKSLNILQGIAPFINEMQSLDDFIGIVPKEYINRFLKLNKTNIEEFVDEFVCSGYSFLQFLYSLGETLAYDKASLVLHQVLSFYEAKAICGCSTELMMSALCYKKIQILG